MNVINTAKKIDIQNIFISSHSAFLSENFDPLVANQILSGQYAINTIKVESKLINDEIYNGINFIKFYIEVKMRYISDQPNDEQLQNEEWIIKHVAAEIIAVFCAVYSIKPDCEVSDEEKTEFGKVNAPYHIWPFWREYSQSICNRMSLPVSIVPMLIIDSNQKKEVDTANK